MDWGFWFFWGSVSGLGFQLGFWGYIFEVGFYVGFFALGFLGLEFSGVGHDPKPELQEHLDSAPRDRVGLWGVLQGLGWAG